MERPPEKMTDMPSWAVETLRFKPSKRLRTGGGPYITTSEVGGLPPANRTTSEVSNDPNTLTSTRKTTHGDWAAQSAFAQELKQLLKSQLEWNTLEPGQREALEMIAVKISRIIKGSPNEPDHWNDIAGYAHLVRGDLDG